jgi:hypothetical protein
VRAAHAPVSYHQYTAAGLTKAAALCLCAVCLCRSRKRNEVEAAAHAAQATELNEQLRSLMETERCVHGPLC